MATIYSYDLKGKKLSFANWISNLSPTDTPFVSMTGKESISQTTFQWQTDYIDSPDKNNAHLEGSVADDGVLRPTKVNTNITQILRKVVAVSDTANAVASYGRGRELQYQMEKAGKELKRDLEHAFLTQGAQSAGNSGAPTRTTAGFKALVAAKSVADPDTGAVVHTETTESDKLSEADIFRVTYNLYLAGSEANIIMFHPKHAEFFATLLEGGSGGRVKMFDGQATTFTHMVDTIVDPLGSQFKLVPNRFMPQDAVYFLNPSDWTQMVFRAPERTKLAKDGSYDKWMIEMEVGLRHRNPYASGILAIKA